MSGWNENTQAMPTLLYWPGSVWVRRHRRRWQARLPVAAGLVLALLGLVGVVLSSGSARAADSSTPIRATFYYPWFAETWHTTDRAAPALGRYSSDNPTIVAAHVAGMKYDGQRAAIASWWGQGQHNEQVRFPQMYTAAAAAGGFGFVPYYEPEGQGDQPLARIQADLTYLRAYADAAPAGTLRIGGRPVIFVYNTAGGCERVVKWSQATRGFTDWYVNMKVFPGFGSCPVQPSSWHQYGPDHAEQAHLPYSFVISPGFHAYNETTPRLARDPARWRANVAHMAASGAQWQLVTTWNEWGEGTAVEPSPAWQSQSGWGAYGDELHRQLVAGPPGPTPSSSASSSPSASPTGAPSPTVSPTSSPPSPSPTPTGPLPRPDHIVVVIFENHDRTQIVGNTNAPWFNAQLSHGAYLSSSVAITHPSLPNYLALWSGSTQGVTDDGCGYTFTTPSLGQQLTAAGLTWRGYAENLPAQGSTVCSASGGYAKKHAPWAYWPTDAPGGTPYSAWPVDFGQLPKVSFVIPNLCDDMHDCSVATGDAWAMAHLDPYAQWAASHNSLLVVTFDENDGAGGNHIYTVVEGAHVTVGTFAEPVNHYRVLRTLEALCGLPGIANAASVAPINDIWN